MTIGRGQSRRAERAAQVSAIIMTIRMTNMNEEGKIIIHLTLI
jgi:hypothetical protein